MNVRKTLLSTALIVPLAVGATPALASPAPTTPAPAVVDPTTPPAPQTETEEPAPTASYVAPVATVVDKKRKKRSRAARRGSRAGGISMRTRGTRFSPTQAVRRLTTWAKQGRRGYHNRCLRLADDAYAPVGGRTSTALSQWRRARRSGYGHRNRYAPVGAQLFWRTSNPAGHIATYVGRGKVVTNVPGGRVKKVSWKRIDRWGPYLGWAEPYYG